VGDESAEFGGDSTQKREVGAPADVGAHSDQDVSLKLKQNKAIKYKQYLKTHLHNCESIIK
jgi:hypothetical protein